MQIEVVLHMKTMNDIWILDDIERLAIMLAGKKKLRCNCTFNQA